MLNFDFPEFYHLEIAHVAVVDHQPHKRALALPAVMSGCSGIDVQAVELFVKHDLQNVRVTGHKKLWPVLYNHSAYAGRVSPRVAAYVGHEHVDSLDGEVLNFVATASDYAAVNVAADGTHHRADALETCYDAYVADITGMPYLVTVLEVNGKTVVPA